MASPQQADLYQKLMGMEDAELRRLAVACLQVRQLDKFTQLERYWPQAPLLKFYAAGSQHRERGLLGANQIGKTVGICAEGAYHATGLYPKWWKGYRFNRGNTGIVVGQTLLLNRDKLQTTYMGFPKDELGSGLIPRELIISTAHSGIKDGYESVQIRHVTGAVSTILFRASEQGRMALQSLTGDWAQFDEEPGEEVYSEVMTRTNFVQGPVMAGFTPLLGMTNVVGRFYGPMKLPQTYMLNFGLDDCELYTDEQKEKMRRDYPEHERQARAEGLPVLGSGLVFPVAWDQIAIEPMEIPAIWRRICGLDFGYDHPTAGAWLAHDTESDVLYLTDVYKQSGQTPVIHAPAIKARGEWIPVAWPHDGLQHSKDSGVQLAEQYRVQGLNMLPEHATHEQTGVPHETQQSLIAVEPGIMRLLTRMQTGRFKVFRHLNDYKAEHITYHRVEGKLVKLNDDVISAVRAGEMMLRFAAVKPKPVKLRAVSGADSWRT